LSEIRGGSFTEPYIDDISSVKAMVRIILEENWSINSFIGSKEISRRKVGNGEQIQTTWFEHTISKKKERSIDPLQVDDLSVY
jgi:hypothetical protein